MFSKVLVIGGAGFIGSHTVDHLLAGGHEVTCVDDLSTGSLANLTTALEHPSFQFIQADILVPGELEKIGKAARPEAMIHLAGLVSVTKAETEPTINFRLNIQGTHMACEVARNQGIRRLIFSSSAATYGDHQRIPLKERYPPRPVSQYGSSKLASEVIIKSYADSFGIETASLRYFNVYGPRQDPNSPYSGVISIFADRFQKRLPVTVFGDGTQTRDFVSVYDVARANCIAATGVATDSSAPLNICTGRRRSLNELIQIFQDLHPHEGQTVYQKFRAGEIIHSGGDPSRTRDVLGFSTNVTLEAGIRDLIDSAKPVRNAELVAA